MFNIDLFIIFIYLITTLFVGIYTGRNIQSIKEYAIGNNKFATTTLIATITATWIAAGSVIGSQEKIYESGLPWIIVFLGEAIAIYSFVLLAPKLIRFKGALSVGEILGIWYGKEARIIGGICVALRNIGTIAAQISAMGYLFNVFFNVQPFMGILIGAGIVIIYSSFGGIKAVTATDVIQFAFLIVTVPLIASVLLYKAGGYQNLINSLPSQYFELFSDNSSNIKYIFLFLFFAIPFWDPSLIQRVLMAKDREQIIASFKITSIIIIFFYICCGIIAFSVYALNNELNSKNILYFAINNYLPNGIKGIGIAGILAVIMSSADSYLNVSSISIIHDVLNPLRKKPLSSNQELIITKLMTLFIGISSIIVAIDLHGMVEIVIKAWMVWAPIVTIPLYAAIFGIKSNIRIFFISAICGIALTFFWEIVNLEGDTGIISVMPGLFFNLIIFTLLTLCYSKFAPHKLYKPSLIDQNTEEYNNSQYIKANEKKNIFNIKPFKKYIPTPNNLARFSATRVAYFGAQYRLFGLFAIASYFIPFFMWSGDESITIFTHDLPIVLRFIAGILAFGLIIHDVWPRILKKYLPLYWHFTLMYCLTFMTSLLYLCNSGTNEWIVNIALSLFILSMLVDWLSFTVILILGTLLGYNAYIHIATDPQLFFIFSDSNKLYALFYVTFFSICISFLFSRNKEYIHRIVISLLEEKVRERTQELEKALEVKTEFLNNISHEVRTPIHGVTAITQGIVEHWDDISELEKKEFAKQAAIAANRLFSLVNNILDLSKMTNNKMDLHLVNTDLLSLAKEVIEESKELYLYDKKIDLVLCKPKVKLPILLIDKQLITQVFRNLFTNAIKFTKEGRIEISFSLTENQIQVQIKDEGIGIPKGEERGIFSAFTQSSRTKTRAGGTGLGLAIVKEIIEMHAGKIWAENNLEKGASFYFILPINMTKEEGIRAESKINILLIDDERICIESMKMMMTGSEFEVIGVEGGSAGLAYLANNSSKIDLILLDMMMPDMYGLEVLEKIKNNPRCESIPVILQTGLKKEEEIQKAYSLGIVNFISKPYKKDEILKALRTSIRFK